MIFTEGALIALWEHSEHGVPRLLNKICKLCMKGRDKRFRVIEEEVVDLVGGRFQRLTGPVAQPRGQRGKRDPKASRPSRTQGRGPAPQALPLKKPLLSTAGVGARKTGVGRKAFGKTKSKGRERFHGRRYRVAPHQDRHTAEILRTASAATKEGRSRSRGRSGPKIQKYLSSRFLRPGPGVLWSDVRKSILNAFERPRRPPPMRSPASAVNDFPVNVPAAGFERIGPLGL